MSTDAAEAEVRALEEKNRRAEMKSDMTALAESWADTFFLVTPMGTVAEKEELLKQIAPDAPRADIDSYEKQNLVVRIHGDAAVSSYRVEVHGRYQANPFSHRFQVTNVWIRRDGRWQIVTTHTALLPEPPKQP